MAGRRQASTQGGRRAPHARFSSCVTSAAWSLLIFGGTVTLVFMWGLCAESQFTGCETCADETSMEPAEMTRRRFASQRGAQEDLLLNLVVVVRLARCRDALAR